MFCSIKRNVFIWSIVDYRLVFQRRTNLRLLLLRPQLYIEVQAWGLFTEMFSFNFPTKPISRVKKSNNFSGIWFFSVEIFFTKFYSSTQKVFELSTDLNFPFCFNDAKLSLCFPLSLSLSLYLFQSHCTTYLSLFFASNWFSNLLSARLTFLFATFTQSICLQTFLIGSLSLILSPLFSLPMNTPVPNSLFSLAIRLYQMLA